MKYNLFFFLLLLLATACNRSDTNTPTTETPLETPNKDSVLLQSIRNTTCGFKEDELTRANSYYYILKGKIDNNYAIVMTLNYNLANKDEAKNTVAVSGNYKYESQDASIAFSGEINLNTKELTLYTEKNYKKDEIFKGSYTDNFDSFSGNWEKLSKGKKMPFELQKTFQKGANTPLWMQYVFALKLNEILQKNTDDVFAIQADSVGVDKNGVYIKNLKTNYVPDFYPNSFSSYFDYESTATYISRSLDAEIWQIENREDFFIYIGEDFDSGDVVQDSDDETGEVTSDITETDSHQENKEGLWLYKNNKFEDILVFDDQQKNADKNYTQKITNMDWYATNEKGIITVFEKKTNKSWVWDVNKEKLTSK